MISNENVVKEQNISNENVEILNIFKNIINNYSSNSIFDFEDYEITYVQVKSLLDYITNLQEENKELKAILEMYENGVYFSSENDELQQRIDKAIEYIDKNIIVNFNKFGYKTDIVAGIVVDELLKILKGSEK